MVVKGVFFAAYWRIKQIIAVSLLFVVLLAGGLVYLDMTRTQNVISWAMAGKTIVVDAGHGGYDPGVIGVSGSREADINLAVSAYLAELLRGGGATVLLTRTADKELAPIKRDDLTRRAALAEGADLFISIHGNAYAADCSQHGAQVFFGNDEQSKALAGALQASLLRIDETNKRVALCHRDSFLLDNVDVPAVLCELGFLSNAEEEQRLLSREYQWQLAYSLYSGIGRWFIEQGNG
ncbi:MAG: N-acetylmuramoyl-L-alanine amidase [Clostridia bacterium]|nr:N-acetylmuramoyl-L-alanine amidase [Clostridia bacterium]